MEYPKISLNPQKEPGLVKLRHPWLFSDAIRKPEGIPDGRVCDVYLSDRKTFFARGYYNSQSKIVLRILTRKHGEDIDQAFFEKKFRALQDERASFIDLSKTNAYRLCFAESDGVPGLIVDRYNDVFVVQIHTLGMDRLKPLVIDALKTVFQPRTIYERSDSTVRLADGLKDCPSQLLFGEDPKGEIVVQEHAISFYVDVIHGQKTGLFLDQRENRKALQQYSAGKTVLNAFCYTAGFSLYSALSGAKETVSVDVSKNAIAAAKRNFDLNQIDTATHEFVVDDVFDYLESDEAREKHFNLILLDPPAFVKNAKSLRNGMAGYLQINEAALRLLPSGGILVSSSCSSHVSDEMFQKMLTIASHRTECSLKVLEIKHQPLDHPFCLDFPEGKYLKFYVLLKQQ